MASSAPAIDSFITFSAIREFIRIFTYSIPALALLWYLILEKKSLSLKFNSLKPKKSDAISFAWGFPGLVLIGIIISGLMALLSPLSSPPRIEAPNNAIGWIVMIFSCLGTGYLEESFFRFYLLQKLEDWIPLTWVRIAFSVLLFALCHSYEGPWGILNAALAGLFLSLIYEKHKTLHGIALSHAAYNAFVYFIGIF